MNPANLRTPGALALGVCQRGTNQDKLLSLLADGWSFEGRDDPDALQCQDQADCGDCLEPCDFRDGVEE